MSSATSTIPLPAKEVFYQKLAPAVTSPKGYAFERDSYDQAFDANMVPIQGKYTVTAWQSVATLYANSHYRNLATSFIHSTPVDLLAEPKSGDEEGATTHDYSLQDDGKQLTYIDDIVEESKESINYAVYDEDIIHSNASLTTAFPSIPNKPLAALNGGKSYFDALIAKDSENYIYDSSDPFLENPVALESNGDFLYSFAVHFSTCFDADEDAYYLNRKYTYFIRLDSKQELVNYGYNVAEYNQETDSAGNTVYLAEAGRRYVYSSIVNDLTETDHLAFPDILVTSQDSEGNNCNAAGIPVTVIAALLSHFDMSTLTLADIAKEETLTAWQNGMAGYLASVTGVTMTGTIANPVTGQSYSETYTRTLYKNNIAITTGELKETPATTDDAGATTYGTEEDVHYSMKVSLSADAITVEHQEDESTVYHMADPTNGLSPLAAFKFDGDFLVPSYWTWNANQYLDPSSLNDKSSTVAIDATTSTFDSDGTFHLHLSDYSSTYVVDIKANHISQVVETLPADDGGAVITKTYVLSEAPITDYAG